MLLHHLRALGALALAGACAILIGCGGSGDSGDGTFTSTNGSTNGSATRGTLNVRMSDAHDPTITSMMVTIDSVEANVDGTWRNVPVENGTVDLMDLIENDILLATGEVPTGNYGQIRLSIASATVTDSAGTHNVKVPSGKVRMNVDYDVRSNDITTLLLDFNVDKSLVKTGNGSYILKPVIPAVVKVLSGTITGTVLHEGGTPAPNTHVRAIYTAGDNYEIGSEVNTANTLEDGRFKLWALLPGTYRLEFSHVDGEVTFTDEVIDVIVEANENTAVGEVTLE